MRRDQQSARSSLSLSGCPIPSKGSRRIASLSLVTLSAFFRSCSIHQARPSKAAGANSKLGGAESKLVARVVQELSRRLRKPLGLADRPEQELGVQRELHAQLPNRAAISA